MLGRKYKTVSKIRVVQKHALLLIKKKPPKIYYIYFVGYHTRPCPRAKRSSGNAYNVIITILTTEKLLFR